MLRTIAISLMLVLSVGMMLPFANEAHGVRQTVQVGQKRRHHRYRSRAWWRRYRARMRQKTIGRGVGPSQKHCWHCRKTLRLAICQDFLVRQLPSLPSNATAETDNTAAAGDDGECSGSASNGATRPRVVNSAHPAFKASERKLPGQMNLAVVALSRPNPAFLTSREEKQDAGWSCCCRSAPDRDRQDGYGRWLGRQRLRARSQRRSRFRGYCANSERCADTRKDLDVLFHRSWWSNLRTHHRFTS